MAGAGTSIADDFYDRLADLKAFDATKSGVQGLVTRRASEVPRIFQRISEHQHASGRIEMDHQAAVPVIDLAGSQREEAVAEIRRACQEWGFFQLVGHGVPPGAMENALVGVRAFHEGDPEVKAALYSRDGGRAAKYSSNFDLYASRVANWRDTLTCRMLPDPPKPEELPQSCREALFEYSKHIGNLGHTLFELLSEALGLNPAHLEEMECNQGQILFCHYYPPCPEPEVAIGTSAHSDSGFLTVLLQDHIGGLQVLHNDKWVEVPPIPGALVINIADLLQLISNDRFKSVEHRVVAKREGPRISIACFFSTHFHPCSTRLYGPIKELISEENPPLYKEIMVIDYVAYYYSRGLDGKSTISHFRLS
ncbi:1-aminocyclopropane-1-carboxylate oxidase homolog 1-like [Zingiber officinale]|uniref:1-aminocyclopropane-1-carboxylate oxidase homolog 1-like n=1 Tax=Zingiber officinale TaxID=94328 RepID=UPI001C4BEDCE|nr:1-aminocyclopropane-1-carboxylate oxidase homolog 1-like [Zingiber officinale]